MARDVETGFLQRLALTPMARSAMLLGHTAGVLFVAVISSVIYLTVGFIFGLSFVAGAGGVVVMFVLGVLIALSLASLGTFIGLRAGSAEAVQGMFPVLFVLVFLSSGSLPRNLIQQHWFRTVATYNPVSYLFEGLRSPILFGWQAKELLLGFGFALAIAVIGVLGASRALRTRLATT